MTGQVFLSSNQNSGSGYWRVSNCGFSGRSSLRFCAILGMISSLLYITAATIILASKVTGGSLKNWLIAVLVASVIQMISDFILFVMASRSVKWKSFLTWGCCFLDRLLFITTFVCSIYVIQSAAAEDGVYLLLALIFGIVSRIYIMFVFRQAVNEIREQGESPVFYPCYPVIICFPM